MLITDLGDKAREWRDKIEAEAKQTEKPTNPTDFHKWVWLSSTWNTL
jgi:hypothetical protein